MALSEAEGLLRIAAADLETAVASSNPSVFREGAWGFWLQQAVEKAFKAWLLHVGEDEPPLTHDLRRLLRLLAARGAVASEWNEPAYVVDTGHVDPPRGCFRSTPHRSLLRDPLPGAAYLSRSPWASAKQLASRPMAMSASPPPSVAAGSPSKSSA